MRWIIQVWSDEGEWVDFLFSDALLPKEDAQVELAKLALMYGGRWRVVKDHL